jgi:hypothetical protein
VEQANAIPERQVVAIWQRRLTGRTDLVTEEGEPIKIIYPGRINDDRGADLLDAVITTSQGLLKGDVEVHVKSSSWWAHRHHQDPIYNRVILHVVFWRDTETAINLQNGQKVPTLALNKFINNRTDQHINPAYPSPKGHMPCRQATGRRNTGFMGALLDMAGEERFLAKSAGFQAALAQTEAGQPLYEGIMGALGYTKNKLPLIELAGRMPLHRLKSVTSEKVPDNAYLAQQQALLLGTAGLLPSQRHNQRVTGNRDDAWIEKLEKIWASSRLTETMSEDDWHLFKVRPSNFPARRIAAMSYLLLRYREKGILEELVNKIDEAPAGTGYSRLEKALQVTTDGYWANHLDFGLPSKMRLPALLGEGRAADIIVNVLLPFAAAWGRLIARTELTRKAFDLYRHYPRLDVNTVERHIRNQLGINHYLVNSAQRQQGLIHIYRTLCSQGKCHQCPIGQGYNWRKAAPDIINALPTHSGYV